MRWPVVLGVVAAGIGGLPACDTSGAGPFGGLPLDGDFAVDVTRPVHVARDRDGTAHIRAESLGDAAFVQGYVMAHDRLPQLDVLRHLAEGSLAELYGAADPSVIDGDLVRRMFRNRELAAQSWATLQASTDELDRRVVRALARFADGVNRYALALTSGDWTLDPALATSFDPAAMAPWTPVDSLAIARWWTISQSFTAPFELDATRLYQQLRATYDHAPETEPAARARSGISRDLWRLAPIGRTAALDGFPNVAIDTGSRADGSMLAAPPTPPAPPARPIVPLALLTSAHDFFGHGDPPAAGGHAFAIPATDGAALGAALAAAIDAPLTNPALLYPTHLIVGPASPDDDSVLGDGDAASAEPPLDVRGATLPGIPGVMLGANRDLAWASTASQYDVNDVYLESLAPCGGGDCAAWTDAGGAAQQVPLEARDEALGVGTLGRVDHTLSARYERAPQHGPIIPAIDPATHTLVPRAAGPALSVRFTADQPTFELRATFALAYAASAAAGVQAIATGAGGQTWMLVDRGGTVDWTSAAEVPVRAAAAYAWDPLVAQDAPAPFFVLPGTGEAEWTDRLAPRYVPHAVAPSHAAVAANADLVGATFDGKPLDQATTDGAPLYVGADYDVGLRQDRIAARVAERDAVSLDHLAAIQADTRSSIGEKFAPMLLTALGRLDRQPIGPPDVNPYLDALPPEDLARLATARSLVQGWTFATPADGGTDSAATALFHTWLHFFVERSIRDELDAIGIDVWQLDGNAILRVIYAMLHDPISFVTSPASQQPILCDNYAVSGPDDSCTKAVLQAMVDAMTYLTSPAGLNDPDAAHWQWGALHQITLAPWPGAPEAVRIPSDGSRIPRPGDATSVERGNAGWADLDFAGHPRGSVYRMTAQVIAGAAADAPGFELRAALAGGAVFDSRSPHSRDQLDRGYLTGQSRAIPATVDEITAAGETRWVFH
ncbi:MAG TPA: penicillin acylase family protein [Kofleriaceae bacterium]